ncbi:GIY-YIG nuclease family protein [Hymenobacter cellulosivorans]|uniref:GIY-YIG nuclease family protein n=1 Tax=Hymenobacter cellulosivorans TaxID=2932249 RepID=A0ABY4F6I4_9BACT|nr:GIY-YIG nuclease family protein [Hymenobacter cellulosivorans]UOQ51524.1 GIY-YIG nuclease family protein [Hymenobacter cellulosivorans]
MFTYIIKEVDSGKVKIGRTDDVMARLKSHQCSNSSELVVIMAVAGNVEAQLHERFHDSRIRGEWFHYTDDIKALVEENSIETNLIVNPKPVKITPFRIIKSKQVETKIPSTLKEIHRAMQARVESENKIKRKTEFREFTMELPEGEACFPEKYYNVREVINEMPPAVRRTLKLILRRTKTEEKSNKGYWEFSFLLKEFYDEATEIHLHTVHEVIYRVFTQSSFRIFRPHHLKRLREVYQSCGGANLIGGLSGTYELDDEETVTISIIDEGLALVNQYYPEFLA